MSAWLDGECPPGDPTTVRQRLDDISAWIEDDKVGADPALLEILDACMVEVTRVSAIQNYEVDKADTLFDAWGKAKTAREMPPGDPAKTDEWRGATDDLDRIQD